MMMTDSLDSPNSQHLNRLVRSTRTTSTLDLDSSVLPLVVMVRLTFPVTFSELSKDWFPSYCSHYLHLTLSPFITPLFACLQSWNSWSKSTTRESFRMSNSRLSVVDPPLPLHPTWLNESRDYPSKLQVRSRTPRSPVNCAFLPSSCIAPCWRESLLFFYSIYTLSWCWKMLHSPVRTPSKLQSTITRRSVPTVKKVRVLSMFLNQPQLVKLPLPPTPVPPPTKLFLYTPVDKGSLRIVTSLAFIPCIFLFPFVCLWFPRSPLSSSSVNEFVKYSVTTTIIGLVHLLRFSLRKPRAIFSNYLASERSSNGVLLRCA